VPMMMSQAVPTSSRMAPMTRSAVSAAGRENAVSPGSYAAWQQLRRRFT